MRLLTEGEVRFLKDVLRAVYNDEADDASEELLECVAILDTAQLVSTEQVMEMNRCMTQPPS